MESENNALPKFPHKNDIFIAIDFRLLFMITKISLLLSKVIIAEE